MDTELSLSIVEDLVSALDHAHRVWLEGDGFDYARAARPVEDLLPLVLTVAAGVDGAPEEAEFTAGGNWEYESALEASLRLARLLRQRTLTKRLEEPDAEQVHLRNLHPWVWESGRPQWVDGHHRGAVVTAAAQIEQRLQKKIGRLDVSGVALVREAFTLKPPEAGKARLRFPGYVVGSEAYTSAHEGASSYGAGCFQVIRNSAAHRPRDLPMSVAVEHMTSLSLFARMVSAARVESVSGSAPRPIGSPPFG